MPVRRAVMPVVRAATLRSAQLPQPMAAVEVGGRWFYSAEYGGGGGSQRAKNCQHNSNTGGGGGNGTSIWANCGWLRWMGQEATLVHLHSKP